MSETETAIAKLHRWLPEEHGLVFGALTIRRVDVRRQADGTCVLTISTDLTELVSLVLDDAAAVHLAACLLGKAEAGEGAGQPVHAAVMRRARADFTRNRSTEAT